MEAVKAVMVYDLRKDLILAKEKSELPKREFKKRICQYENNPERIYKCEDCFDILTCKCDEAEEFKSLYIEEKSQKKINHSDFLQFYNEKRSIEKLSEFLSSLNINKFRRKLSIILARIKKIYFIPFIHKIGSSLRRRIKKWIMRDIYVY